MIYTDDQNEASKAYVQFLLDPNAREFVLEGYSGCGKTTLTKRFIELAKTQVKFLKYLQTGDGKLNYVLTALTHKAAKALQLATGEETHTIHSYMKLRVYNDYRSGRTRLSKAKDFVVPKGVLVFIDEASMVDDAMLDMIRSSTSQCKVVWIGDPKQLLGVMAKGAPVFDNPPYGAKLTKVVRQVAGHPIIDLATQIRLSLDGLGPMPSLNQSIGTNVHYVNGSEFQEVIEKHMRDPDYSPDDAKILAWRNETVKGYNAHVRAMHTSEPLYQVGERLVVNSAVVANQEVIYPNETIITIKDLRPDKIHGVSGQWITPVGFSDEIFVADDFSEATLLIKDRADKKEWLEYFELKETFADLRPTHACTVHKSQGSTFKNVFINLTDIGANNNDNEIKRLLYVAITRAAENVYLYGELPERLYTKE